MNAISPDLQRSLAQADAVYAAQVDEQWRAWRTYLNAHLTLLAAQAAAATLAFENSADADADQHLARADLDHLPSSRRVLFDAVVAHYRTQVGEQLEAERRAAGGRGPALDADEVDQRVFTMLLDSANGHTDDGRGLVPMAHTETGELVWYSVDCVALEGVPDVAAFAVGTVSDREKRRRLLGVLALTIGGVLFFLAWLAWSPAHSSAESPAPDRPAPLVNDQAITPWPVTELLLASSTGDTITLPVKLASSFPPNDSGHATPTAWQDAHSLWPLELCVSDAILAGMISAQLGGTGGVPARIYTLQPPAANQPDLRLTHCQGESDPENMRYGMLQTTAAIPSLSPGDQALIDPLADPATQITLQGIQVIGPGQDLTLPDNQQRVLVSVLAPPDLDWPRFTPTLLLMDGQTAALAETQPFSTGIELRYVLPLMTIPSEVAWQITRPDTGQVVRWRTLLDPPPDRATILTRALVVETLTADPLQPGQALLLQLVISNQGSQPIQLNPEDIIMTQGETRLATPALPAPPPLLPGQQQTISLTVPIDPWQPLTLALGHHQFQIALTP